MFSSSFQSVWHQIVDIIFLISRQYFDYAEVLNEVTDSCKNELKLRIQSIKSEIKYELDQIKILDDKYDNENVFGTRIDLNQVDRYADQSLVLANGVVFCVDRSIRPFANTKSLIAWSNF